MECRQVTVYARFIFFHSPLQFGAGEIAVAVVDYLNLLPSMATMFCEQSQLLTQQNELATDASDGLAVVFSEVGDDLEIRHQTPGQPHQLNVALSFSLQTSARLDAVEIAVYVDLKQNCGMVSRPANIGWNGTFKTRLPKLGSSTKT